MLSSELAGWGRKGDVDFAVIVENFRQQVHRWLYAAVGPGADLDELTQCVFIRAFSRWGRFDPTRGSFCTWLHKITHNVAMSSLRQRNRAPESLDALAEDEAPTCAGPAEEYAKKALCERLLVRLAALDSRRRHAFLAHHLRGLTWPEVAAEMECCEHSARNWSAEAAEELRRGLSEDGPDGVGVR